jgi:hypothetical protein
MNMKLFIFLLVLFINISHTFTFENNKEKKIFNASLLASKWLQQNKRDLNLISDQELKFILYQELVTKINAKINQKTFNEVFKIVLKEKKMLFLLKSLSKMHKLRPG